VLKCSRCGARMQLIVALSEPSVLKRILAHLELPTTLPHLAPARAPPWSELDLALDLEDLDKDPDPDLDTAESSY
jgi:hypothetical protein